MKTAIFAAAALCLLTAGPALASNAGGLNPEQTIQASVRALRQNDIRGLMMLSVGEEQLQIIGRNWDKQRRRGANEQEQREFAQALGFLISDGAEQRLMQLVRPKLEELRPQWSMTVGMVTGMLQSSVEMNEDLDSTEKQQARLVMEGFSKLLQATDFTSASRANKAIGALCATARRLDIRTMGDVQRLSFDQLLSKGDLVLAGVKDVLAIYGMDMNGWLDSIKTESLYQSGDSATVRVTFDLMGAQQTVDTDLILMNGRWMGKDSKQAAQLIPFGG